MAQSGSPGGVTLEMVVINQTELTNLAEAMQFYWREVGINVEIAQGDQATMRERTDAGDYMFTVSNSTWFTGDPSRPTVNFTSQRKNYGFNEEILANTDRLWEQGVQTIDLDARVAIYDELTEYIMEQWVFFPIAHKKIYYAHNDKVENFFANPSGSPDFQRVRIRQ